MYDRFAMPPFTHQVEEALRLCRGTRSPHAVFFNTLKWLIIMKRLVYCLRFVTLPCIWHGFLQTHPENAVVDHGSFRVPLSPPPPPPRGGPRNNCMVIILLYYFVLWLPQRTWSWWNVPTGHDRMQLEVVGYPGFLAANTGLRNEGCCTDRHFVIFKFFHPSLFTHE